MNDASTAALKGAFELAPLPFEENALEPAISARTVAIHHGKHHRAYVENLGKLVAGTELASLSLEQVIAASAQRPDRVAIFNNASQAWNHAFYWASLRRDGGGEPPRILRQRIEDSFGTLAACRKELAATALAHFGSGWAWLVADATGLRILSTADAHGPDVRAVTPLLTVDVWEHAYYLDYQNRRADYLAAVIERHLNWGFACENLEKAALPAAVAA